MFDSGISAKTFITQIKEEADIAPQISDERYIVWLNALEQLLYSEIIKEQRQIAADVLIDYGTSDMPVYITGRNRNVYIDDGSDELITTIDSFYPYNITAASRGEDDIRFEDIHAVYADGTQLIKSTAASGTFFPDTYYKTIYKKVTGTVLSPKETILNGIGFKLKTIPETLTLVYHARPILKTADNYDAQHVMLPVEFIEPAAAKLRGEAYKLANEDSLSAKWLNDYNILLETFKAWMSARQAEFGL